VPADEKDNVICGYTASEKIKIITGSFSLLKKVARRGPQLNVLSIGKDANNYKSKLYTKLASLRP